MDKSGLKELQLIIELMNILDQTISTYMLKHNTAPAAYTYLYELCVLRLLVIMKGHPEFITRVSEITDKAILSILRIVQQSNPQDKELTDKLNKMKQMVDGNSIKIPDTVDKLLKEISIKDCTSNPKEQDPGDKAIDAYLRKKEEIEKAKKRGQRRKKRKNETK